MKSNYEPKPLFIERMKLLLGNDFKNYWEKIQERPLKSIRVNTLKISPEELKKKLENKNWKIEQPFKKNPEIIIIKSELQPGELGRSLEHLLGYYYVQEISSMMPVLVLNPKPNEIILDLCASPGSKTTQIAAKMENTGTLIANDYKLGRIKILSSNLERCGVMNTIITKARGEALCRKLKEINLDEVDKILIDTSCSGEGTIKSSPKTLQMWNIRGIFSFSKIQKNLLERAIEILKPNGEIVYSTCTHAPEENEEVIDFILKKFDNIKIEKIFLPLKTREGITKWQEKEYLEDVKYSCRIYPQDNDTDGFFIAKLRKVK
ncbi:MAG TPA: RsmB/NOP family class I SAM-dependent RNA methyltransferase [Ignavibacteria bacterium]|nr:RsmB/NOP family class I SAM-dependent RNA methyltransferase [Ignavibacteria bacterium]